MLQKRTKWVVFSPMDMVRTNNNTRTYMQRYGRNVVKVRVATEDRVAKTT